MIPDNDGPNAPEPVQHAPGIYFGMPMAEYHADHALGSSSIRDLNVSPITFWRNSKFNPEREADDTDASELGDAYHARLLEGPEVFAERFGTSLDEDDHPEALKGAKALAERCVALGLAKSGTIAELEARILTKDPSAILWTRLLSDHGKANAGRTLLKPATMRKVEQTAAIVAKHPHASMAISGGYSEVSIFWEDPETGVRCKARLDHLKPGVIADLKSFSTKGAASVDRAISSSIARYGYLTQWAHYAEGLEMVKAMLREGTAQVRIPPARAMTVEAITDLSITATEVQNFGDRLAVQPPHAFVFVFVESCPFPAVRVRECLRKGPDGQETLYWKAGKANVRRALTTYAACMQAFGPDRPWVDAAPMSPFTDEELFYSLDK